MINIYEVRSRRHGPTLLSNMHTDSVIFVGQTDKLNRIGDDRIKFRGETYEVLDEGTLDEEDLNRTWYANCGETADEGETEYAVLVDTVEEDEEVA